MYQIHLFKLNRCRECIVLILVSTCTHFGECAHLYSWVHAHKIVSSFPILQTSAVVCTDFSWSLCRLQLKFVQTSPRF